MLFSEATKSKQECLFFSKHALSQFSSKYIIARYIIYHI